jgi:hypothetical protein
MALLQCPTNRPFGEGRCWGDSANSLEGLIEWNSMAPSSSRERLQSAANVALSQGDALPQNLMHPLSCKPIAPVPKFANRTPLALVIDSLLVRTANYAVGDRDGSRPMLFDKFKNLAGDAGIVAARQSGCEDGVNLDEKVSPDA